MRALKVSGKVLKVQLQSCRTMSQHSGHRMMGTWAQGASTDSTILQLAPELGCESHDVNYSLSLSLDFKIFKDLCFPAKDNEQQPHSSFA